MSSIGSPHTVRCERAPLRDVQNERSALQQTPRTAKVCEGHSDQKENLSEPSFITDSDPHLCRSHTNTSGKNITFRSFTCAGGEVGISDRADLSDQSVLIPHAVSNTTTMTHKDHPYRAHTADGKQEEHVASESLSHTRSSDVTFMSFTCPGGEVELAGDESVVHDESMVTEDPASENPAQSFEDEVSEHTELPSQHFDHLYCDTQTSELRSEKMEEEQEEGGAVNHAFRSISINTPDITFKSFTCPGEEVGIAEESLLQCDSLVKNESLIADDSELQNLQSETCDEHTELPSRHLDHPYCNTQTSELRSEEMEEEDGEEDGDGSVIPPSISKNATDVTFKSFACPGGEVEIAGDESIVHDESVVAEDPNLENPTHSFEDEVSEHTELPSRHLDHPYCNTQTSEQRSGEMVEEDGGGSVIPPSISISKNTTDVTFKSFTCPGGEVEITEESLLQCDSLMKNESLVQDESLVPKDSELQNLQSEDCDEHTELPSRHLDHPYCSDGIESSTCKGKGSVTSSSMLDTNSPEGVRTINDSSSALNGSAAADRRDDVTFHFSGAEVELENMYKTFDTPMLMNNLIIYHQARSSPSTELSEHGGESVLISEKDGRVYCHVVKTDPRVSVSENDTHLRVQISSSGVWESSGSAVRYEGSQNMKSEMMVPEGSSDTTEVPNVKSVQQQDLDQEVCANLEENVLKDENTRLRCDENDEISHSHPGAERIPEKFGSTECKSVQNHNMINQNADDANVSRHGDPEVLRSESMDVEAQMKMWSHIVLSEPSTPKHSALGHFWLSESPIPPPQLHSTVLTAPLSPKPVPASDHELQKEKVIKDFSAVGKGPLQDQLRKLGELLIAASGKLSAPAAVTPVEQHDACVWTTPTLRQECSTNTSAIVEERREMEVSDACTSTDPLLWSVSRSKLECLSRSELEQKLISTLIMVEVLSQQLTSAQNQHLRGSGEASPSSLRDRLVQTEHTELSRTEPYRELYVSALERIQTLEVDQETFHNLHQAMQLMSNTMMSVKSEVEEALCSMKELEGVVTDDQEIQSQQVGQMKALFARCTDMLRKMEQKSRVCVKDRDDMKQQMEEALEEKSTVLRVLEQLRNHHTTQVSDLQRNLGSHEELTDALTHTYPQLVELNRMHMDSVTEANTLLRETLEDHTHLLAELHKAQQLLQRTYPLLQKLQHRASAAIQRSTEHQEERDRALEDREQTEQQLYETHSGLQEARQQVADLNTQITIMSSEMAVLREQLTEVEDERSQLQRKTTELSATVSSTLASYAFLEQTLASETSKLQRSLHDTQEANERADGIQAALCVCEGRLEELEQMLVQRENLISELGAETESQRLQLRRLTQVQSELSNTKEMSEFLQAENELTREQLAESEGLLRSHLQGLRERNLECEDLRVELQQLRMEREYLQQELVSTRDKARLMLLDQGEQLAQATLDSSLLLQRVCALISATHPTHHNHKSTDGTVQTDPSPVPQPCSSFLNSVITALTEEQPCDTAPPTEPESCVEEEDLIRNMGKGSSAFTRITPAALQNTNDDERSTTLLELLSSLGECVSELHSAIEQLKQGKDSEIHTLHKSIRDLQEEMETQNNRHAMEGVELKQQVGRLKGQVEKDAQVLQQKTQDDKALRKLCSELEEKLEAAQKHRAENSELRREGADLRRLLQQSQVEVQVLRAELGSTGQSAASMKDLDDRIRLLREVEKLKASLMEVEEMRSKLLERAKRHQMVHAMNQSKLERELHLLDDMIEAVRKALSSVPDVVNSCPELQKLVEFLG
ncbi:sperm-associated antigen 5 [Neoarius graeffei]|uniref:sperm-associated antigen 5 n=1 Tax=Neoarius graeffei TaxID=443677 RepID=UPI00298C69F6|nr:sperm-associated antigen 5 [Neoarius graeffei]